MNSWKKVMTNTSTLRFNLGSWRTKSTAFSDEADEVRHALYCLGGMTGDSSSRSQSLNSDAATWGFSIPCYDSVSLGRAPAYHLG